ncbi:S1 RNA binding domain protein [Selenomonas sp. FOBRC6]|nr:S1 RNA binding domain protein [Selenomonas sp. FOBRC6]
MTGITNFGAFVELPEGKTGLIHISEVADVYVNDVHDFLRERDTVKVKVLTVDDRGKIGLSIKALQDKAAAPAQPSAAPARPPRPPRDMRRTAASRQIGSPSFEDKLSRFLKDSDERLTDLRRKTDSKRGGRGSRRG